MRQIGLGLVQDRVGGMLVSQQLLLTLLDNVRRRDTLPSRSATGRTDPRFAGHDQLHRDMTRARRARLARPDKCRAAHHAGTTAG